MSISRVFGTFLPLWTVFLLNTVDSGGFQPFTLADTLAQFPGEFLSGAGTFAFSGLGVGSGWYIGEGGE